MPPALLQLGRAVLAVLAMTAPAAAQPLLVTGSVLDEQGRPLAGAEVALAPLERIYDAALRELDGAAVPPPVVRALTGSAGTYRLEVPGPGMWRLEVRAPGRLTMERRLVPLLEPEEMPLVLPPRATPLAVRLLDPTGRPLAGGRIWMSTSPAYQSFSRPSAWQPAGRRGLTGEDGRVTLSRGEGETLWVAAVAPGHGEAAAWEAGGDPLDLELSAALSRPVLVVDEAGKPIPGALIYGGEGVFPVALTGADGLARVDGAGNGRTPLTAMAADGSWGTGKVEPPGRKERRPPLLEVQRPQRLTGRVVQGDSGGAAVGAYVWLASDPASVVRAAPDGSFELSVDARRPSRPGVRAAAPGYFEAGERIARGNDGLPQSVELVLEPKAVLYGRVVVEDGSPVADAAVRLQGSSGGGHRGLRGGGSASALTAADGRFSLPVVANTVYQMQVSKEGFADLKSEVAPGGKALQVVLSRGRDGRGRVMDGDRQPVAGATVMMSPVSENDSRAHFGPARETAVSLAVTDHEGRFELPHLPPGRFHLDVTASGYAPRRRLAVQVPAGSGSLDLGEVVLEAGVALQGLVLDASGKPLSGARVEIRNRSFKTAEEPSDGRLQQTAGGSGASRLLQLDYPALPSMFGDAQEPVAISGSDGHFVVGDLAPGERLSLEVSLAGFASAWLPGIEVPRAEPLRVVLLATAILRGRVEDLLGRPLPSAAVTIVEHRGAGSSSGSEGVDAEGRFERTAIQPGRLTLSARADGFRERETSLTVEPGAVIEELRLVLEPGAQVAGRVTRPDGSPCPEARVSLEHSGLDRFWGRGDGSVSGPDGSYRLGGIEPGEHLFVASLGSFRPLVRQWFTVAPGLNRLDFVLPDEEQLEVHGRVIDVAGRPVGGAAVSLEGLARHGGGSSVSGADGSFVITEVEEGDYRLRASKDGYAPYRSEEVVHVASGPVDGLSIRLVPGGSIRGRVLSVPERLLPALAISASGADGMPASTSVDGEGGFVLPHLVPGEWTVTARDTARGRMVEAGVLLEEGQSEAHVELDFGTGVTVFGWVRVDGRPEPAASLELEALDASGRASAYTSFDGRFEASGLSPGRYRVSVQVHSSSLFERHEIEAYTDTEHDFDLETANLSGRVLDAGSSQPLAGARVRLVSALDGAPRPREIETDSDGRFDLGAIAIGPCRVQATARGYAAAEQAIEVEAGRHAEIELALEPASGLVLAVETAWGSAPDFVQVAALDAEGRLAFQEAAACDQQGRCHLSRPAAGRWRLLVGAATSATVPVDLSLPGPAGEGRPISVLLPLPTTLALRIPALASEPTPARAAVTNGEGRPFLGLSWRSVEREWPVRSGSGSISSVPPGRWTVVVTTSDGRSWQGEVDAPASGGTVAVELQ